MSDKDTIAALARENNALREALQSIVWQFNRKLSMGSIDNILEARVYREEIEAARKLLVSSDLEALKEANK